jgi:hypothetical protein
MVKYLEVFDGGHYFLHIKISHVLTVCFIIKFHSFLSIFDANFPTTSYRPIKIAHIAVDFVYKIKLELSTSLVNVKNKLFNVFVRNLTFLNFVFHFFKIFNSLLFKLADFLGITNVVFLTMFLIGLLFQIYVVNHVCKHVYIIYFRKQKCCNHHYDRLHTSHSADYIKPMVTLYLKVILERVDSKYYVSYSFAIEILITLAFSRNCNTLTFV